MGFNTRTLFLFIIILFLVSSLTFVIADENSTNFQSVTLEDFELDANGKPKRYWIAVPDRFGREGSVDSGKSLQKLSWVEAWPEAIFGKNGEFNNGIEKKSYKNSLALWIAFNRQGYNSVEIYPVQEKDGKYEKKLLPLQGRVQQIDMWVWGSNYNYTMELVLMDYRGVEHRLPIGNIRHAGWKNFVINIPNYIPQSVSYIPSLKQLSLMKIVIWTTPKEKVSGSYVYIDHIKYLSDIFETKYDGYNLGDMEEVNSLWEKGPKGPDESELVR